MSKLGKRLSGRRGSSTGRKSKNTYTSKSGKTIKINRSLTDKIKARKDSLARARAQRLAGMPKGHVKRFFFRLHPKRLYKYWFSREGAIMALKLSGIGLIAGFLLLVGLFAYFRKDLPNLRDISGNNIGGSIRYYDRTGETLLWEDFDAVKRIPVESDQINDNIKNATIAIEDKDFFRHGGFDVRGITRAAWNNAFGSGSTQGASTISQQLVRLTQSGVNQDRTYARKVKELILAVELERSYTKDEILTGYLNTAPYGNVQYGVESASRDYFQKPASKLTLAESAFLATIPQAPSYYSPYGPNYNPEALIGRQHYILDLMERQGMITEDQRDEAKQVDILATVKEPKQKFAGITAPYFALAAKEFLEEKFGAQTVQRGGWKVITTVDLKLQRLAEQQVADGIGQVQAQGGDVAAFVAEDVKTGQVVALVGGPDFTNKEFGQNNYAKSYRLPPGSSFKPYDYAALIEKTDDFGAGSVLYDTQGPLPGYSCTDRGRPPPNGTGNCLWDYDFRFPGPLTLRYALGGSRNVPAVKAMLTVGVDETIEVANSMGLKSGYKCYVDDTLTEEGPCYASSAIGDGAYLKLDEHVHGFSAFSRGGRVIPQTYILEIKDASGKIVDEWKSENGEQAIREDTAYIISDILSDPKASYMSRKIHDYNGWDFAVKTGTTNDAKDGLMMGYSSKYAAGVWVGYHNRTVEMSGFMETMTTPIWAGWMNAAHENLDPVTWKKPASVQTLPAYVVRNHVGVSSIEPSPENDLYPAWYKKRDINKKRQVIDKVSKKLATECTPARAKQTISGGDASSFSGDQFVDGASGAINTSARDDVHKCSDVKPSVSLTINKSSNNKYQFVAKVSQGTHPISSEEFPGQLVFSVDGNNVKTQQIGGPGTYAYTHTNKGSGSKQVTVTVIDSVLYDNSDSGSYTVEAEVDPELDAESDGSDTFFVLSGGAGGIFVYDADDDDLICSSPTGTSCDTEPDQDLEGIEVYARDKDGNLAPTVTVTTSGP